MSIRQEIQQRELARRASDDVRCIDSRAVNQALELIIRAGRDAQIEFGYSFTPSEIEELRVRLNRQNRHLQRRTSFVPGIRLADGAGTLIIVGSKK